MVDPANPAQTGFGGRSTALNLTVDTAPPPVQFGGPGFNGLVTDTGVPVEPETAQDLVTSDTTPTFAGLAEANSIIRVFAAITNPNNPNFSPNPVFPNNYVQLGLTVAIPLDGTNAFPNGQWTLTSLVDLNNPDFFDPADGERNLIVTAEDLAGNIGSPVGKPLQNLSIFLDTSGPRIEGVNISNPITGVENTNFNLFGLKPDNQNQGPTPLVYSITIDVVDNPPRTLAHLENAIKKPVAEAPGGILVIGDQVGEVAIAQIIATNNPPVPGQPATATVQLIFTAPLPDDRYTLHIFDTSIVDPAGNLLDGESNAQEPIGIPTFPSGNGINGGDFFARFTVNTRPNIGVDGNGIQQLDVNGNGFYDPVNAHDATNSDKSFAFARYSDNLFAGNFAPAGQDGNGFQRLGAYGVANGKFRFILSFAGIADTQKTIVPTLQINGLPVAYKFNPNVNADEIAVFDGKGNWYIDFNHTNNLTSKSLVISDGLRGYPVAGDFDGNGSFDLATYQPDTNTWQFDLNPLGPNHAFRTLTWGFAGVMERPVAADMNADGITDIGLFVPTSMSPIATPASNWYFLESTPGPADPVVAQAILGGVPTGLALGIQGTINALNHPFSDTPFSQDQHFFFGDGFSQPIVGLWDPPLPAAAQLPVLKTVGTFSDVAVQAEIDKIASGGMAGRDSRRAANGQTQYWGGVTRTGNTYTAQIQKLVGGKVQTLASRTVTLPARSILRLETVGTTLKLYLNKSLVLTVADASIRGTGTAGTWSSPLSVVWTPTATTLTRTPTTLPYSNAPKLPTGTLLDSSWDQWSGSFVGTGSGIGGQAKSNLATLFGLSQKNVSVQADISALAAGNFAGLVLRYNAATGDMVYGQVVNTKGTYYAEIWRVSHGVATRLTHVSLGKTAPHHLRFDAVGTLYTLSVDSHLAGQISDWTSYQGGTVGLQGGAGSRFANFSAQAI